MRLMERDHKRRAELVDLSAASVCALKFLRLVSRALPGSQRHWKACRLTPSTFTVALGIIARRAQGAQVGGEVFGGEQSAGVVLA